MKKSPDPTKLHSLADWRVFLVPRACDVTMAPAFEAFRADLSVTRHFAELSVAIHSQPIFIWPSLWDGTVTLPANQPEGARYRLAVAEYEEYITDDATPYDPTLSAKGRRVVFLQMASVINKYRRLFAAFRLRR